MKTKPDVKQTNEPDVKPLLEHKHDVKPNIKLKHDVKPNIKLKHDVKPNIKLKHDVKMIRTKPDTNKTTYEEEKVALILGTTAVFTAWWMFK